MRIYDVIEKKKHGGELLLENRKAEDAVCGSRVTAVFGVEPMDKK